MDSIVKNLIEYIGIDQQIPPNYSVSAFRELMLQTHIQLPECFPDIEQITRVTTCVDVQNTYVINTPVSARDGKGNLLNPGGQTLTGKKLVIEGIIHQAIYYVADNCTHNVMVLEADQCFGTFVVLPATATAQESCYTVLPYVEDVMVHQMSPRDVMSCVSLFLEVK